MSVGLNGGGTKSRNLGHRRNRSNSDPQATAKALEQIALESGRKSADSQKAQNGSGQTFFRKRSCSKHSEGKKSGSTMRTCSLGTTRPTVMEGSKQSRLAALGRLLKPWKWKRRKKSEKFEQTSRTLERKISMRATKEELIQRGVLLPEVDSPSSDLSHNCEPNGAVTMEDDGDSDKTSETQQTSDRSNAIGPSSQMKLDSTSFISRSSSDQHSQQSSASVDSDSEDESIADYSFQHLASQVHQQLMNLPQPDPHLDARFRDPKIRLTRPMLTSHDNSSSGGDSSYHVENKENQPAPYITVTKDDQSDSDSDSDNLVIWRDYYGDDEHCRLFAKIARKDSLALKLAQRPDKQELIDKNIIHLQSHQERMECIEAVGKRLTRRLSLRPTPEELEQRNILKNQSPEEMRQEKEQMKKILIRKLSFRPTIDELKERKIIRFNDYVEMTKAQDYDRRADKPWTRLTPKDKAAIRKELNEFKSLEMQVHEESKHLTRFHRP